MLPTSYDSLSNELIGTTTSFGEIVFGESEYIYTANTPIPFEPSNNKRVLPQDSLALRWTGQGVYDLFQIQVFSDSLSDSVIDTTMNSSFYILRNIINHTIYFWRVRSILNSEASNWSPIWSFEVNDAFITITSPNDGEVWSMGSENVIRWETNITDSVRLDLLYGQQVIGNIVETTFGYPSAYQWLIPANLIADTSYKIIVVSVNDSSIIDTSDVSFSIISPSGVELISPEIPNEYNLFQNYPNPFNPSTIIKFSLPEATNVTLKIYNTLGQKVGEILNTNLEAGWYSYQWDANNMATGIYIYELRTNKFISVKKMILLR